MIGMNIHIEHSIEFTVKVLGGWLHEIFYYNHCDFLQML